MSKKSLIKRPQSAYATFMTQRKKELIILLQLPKVEINDLVLEEWSLMSIEDKAPYVELAKNQKLYFEAIKDEILEVGVDSFMKSIKEARRQKEIKEEYKEDDVLSILNHKKRWKKTWTKKKKEAARIHKKISPIQFKKISKLKLN
jgi:HMG-box domain